VQLQAIQSLANCRQCSNTGCRIADFFGPDRVLLGSDYPFDMGVERPAEIVRALGLPAQQEAAILAGNARRLLGREVSA